MAKEQRRRYPERTGALSIVLALLFIVRLDAQVPFTESGQVFCILDDQPSLSLIGIDPSNNAIRLIQLVPDLGYSLNALGFRHTDQMLYALNSTNRHLMRIDATGAVTDLGALAIDANLSYIAGDVTPDGTHYLIFGSVNGSDRKMYLVDLVNPGLAVTQVLMPGVTHLTDVAIDPTDPGMLYGYDENIRAVTLVNLNNYDIEGLSGIAPDVELQGVYFNAFGEMSAIGTSTGGVAGALYAVDKYTGVLTGRSSGPVNRIADVASIPYSIEMEISPSIRLAFPCNEVIYTVAIANSTGSTYNNIDFSCNIPAGFDFKGMQGNAFGGASALNGLNQLKVTGMTIPPGKGQLRFKIEVGNIPVNRLRMQGTLHNLPARYGNTVLSDDPLTVVYDDSTWVQVNRIDEDSIILTRFMCLGETLKLNGGEFGAAVKWKNGSTDPILEVTDGGQYICEVVGGCSSTIIVFNVTAASCPFTIEVDHSMEPWESLPCSEVLFRFQMDNQSGAERKGLLFTDTLPQGMEFVKIISNTMGGQLVSGLPPEIIHIKDMTLPIGIYELELLVAVGDIPPGEYRNQALLQNFPPELGPRRMSNDPRTPELDSTVLLILGVETDTLLVDEIICRGSTLTLDGESYGIDYQWYDGSTDATHDVNEPGSYELVVFDGCEPTYIFFIVEAGEYIDIAFDSARYNIHLGDSLYLDPQIVNAGNVLDVRWSDPLVSSVRCDTCLSTIIYPKRSGEYGVWASNEHCTDSAFAFLAVDNTRRLFVPNIFTPNHDGVNDIVYLFTPDYAEMISFDILDRWGNVLYTAPGVPPNTTSEGWDGFSHGKEVPAGTYLWSARIRFLDDITESFAGTICLIR